MNRATKSLTQAVTQQTACSYSDPSFVGGGAAKSLEAVGAFETMPMPGYVYVCVCVCVRICARC